MGFADLEEEVTLSLDTAFLSSKMTWGLEIFPAAAAEWPGGK